MTRDAEHADRIRRCTTVAECHALAEQFGDVGIEFARCHVERAMIELRLDGFAHPYGTWQRRRKSWQRRQWTMGSESR